MLLYRVFSNISFGILYVVFPMDIHSRILMELQQNIEALETRMKKGV
jgi:hypothetical protein